MYKGQTFPADVMSSNNQFPPLLGKGNKEQTGIGGPDLSVETRSVAGLSRALRW